MTESKALPNNGKSLIFLLDSSVGNKDSKRSCSLAQDMKERYPDLIAHAFVSGDVIRFTLKDPNGGLGDRWEFPVEPKAFAWLKKFDSGKQPEDLSIVLSWGKGKILRSKTERKIFNDHIQKSRTRPIEDYAATPRKRSTRKGSLTKS